MIPKLLLVSNDNFKNIFISSEISSITKIYNIYKINIIAKEKVLSILVIEQEINAFNATTWAN